MELLIILPLIPAFIFLISIFIYILLGFLKALFLGAACVITLLSKLPSFINWILFILFCFLMYRYAPVLMMTFEHVFYAITHFITNIFLWLFNTIINL